MNRLLRSLVLLSYLSALPIAYADELAQVGEILFRASKVLQEENYRGRFTYEFGSTLETLELIHAVKDGVEYERVSHLSGLEREFVRNGRQLDCVSAGSFLLRGGLISSQAGIIGLSQNYHFFLQGSSRIADREAHLVKLVPRDEFRYGMTLAFDQESGLPLMSLTTVSPTSALERFQFVDLQVGIEIPSEDLKAKESKYKTFDGATSQCSKNPIQKTSWLASWLPPGFVLSQANSDANGGSVLTYTDGLASFTLFVSLVDSSVKIKEGAALRGATTALMSSVPYKTQNLSVILIGEVPLLTADRVATSVKRVL